MHGGGGSGGLFDFVQIPVYNSLPVHTYLLTVHVFCDETTSELLGCRFEDNKAKILR